MQWNSGIWWWGHCLWGKKVKPEDAGCSTQWNSGIWWWGHCLWGKKVKPEDAVCSTQWNSGIWWWGHCLWCKKVKPVDGMDAVCSGIVEYGGGDIVFGAKRSNQWMEWMECTVVYAGGDIVLWCKKIKPEDAVDAVCSGHSGIVIYGGGDIVFGAKRLNQWMEWMQ